MARFGANSGLNASGLLAALHELFVASPDKSLFLDSATALVIDRHAPGPFLERVIRHAITRNEDELLLLYPAHSAAHSLLLGTLQQFPDLDARVLTALSVLQPFLTAMTPANLNERFHNSVSVKLSLNSAGEVVSVRLSLADAPLLNLDPLLALPTRENYRSFDVFYHMLYSQDTSDLMLKPADQYSLLNKSGTYLLPEWVAFADDYALAKDWADNAQEVFTKTFCQALMMTLSGILLLGDKDSFADGASLIGLDYTARHEKPNELIKDTYLALLQSVEAELNRFLQKLDLQSTGSKDEAIFSVITLAELATTHEYQATALRNKFDLNTGINSEMVQDGLELPKMPASVQKSLKRLERGRCDYSVLRSTYRSLLDESAIWFKDPQEPPFDLDAVLPLSRAWQAFSIAPSATAKSVADQTAWNSSVVSTQIRDLCFPEWIQRAQVADYTADYDTVEFLDTFAPILPPLEPSSLPVWAAQHFSSNDFFQGHDRVYLSENAWTELNTALDAFLNTANPQQQSMHSMHMPSMPSLQNPHIPANSLHSMQSFDPSVRFAHSGVYDPQHTARTVPSMAQSAQLAPPENVADVPMQVEEMLEPYYTQNREDEVEDDGDELDENDELIHDYKGLENVQVEVFAQSQQRRMWVMFVWLLTWWIPSPLLTFIGKMKRKDVRLAWREKVAIFFLIFLFNAFITFYMIVLGRLICPEYDKVWNHKELSEHQGTSDFYVGIHGNVYDITKFYTQQHSDNGVKTSSSVMLPFAGLDLSDYFPPPLTVACPSLVTDESVKLVYNTTKSPYTEAMHTSGSYYVPSESTALHNYTWYDQVFLPKIMNYYKGQIVETNKDYAKKVAADSSLYLVTLNKKIYDMTNYILTINTYPSSSSTLYEKYNFFPSSVTNLFLNYQGTDISEKFNALDEQTRSQALECMNNAFVYAYPDFRQSAKCQTANIILLALAGLLTSVTLIKFLASIRLGPKPFPAMQDKYVICQVPVYTEGEDDMRLAIDSLTNLDYDNKRKLMVLICDGMITGAGNDRPTPEIVLEVLGVDETRVNPKPCAYHAIAEGSKELNYAKVYSGLYENEGDIVPFLCIVKIGAPGETRPGNRGKRDSQLILMNFLNRVHYADPMCPLDLELFHHLNNIIGVEPERFEYLLTVDADTKVHPESLNRMVAACVADNNVSAVCGETAIQNEKESLSTMVQVYEYFISHHLTKAFESLFGSVTCLPGCFSLYRLYSVKRAKPLLISSEIIRDYSLRHVDTLHKKNLFSLGEDRYLTTLMSKHYAKMRTKFIADAKCETRVPAEFSVLLSQRRRWINSTVHNLAELLYLPTLCGFCVFSMRGIVFIDLVGTLLLPSVVIYLVYLIYVIASKTSPLPLISIVLIAAVYGLQGLVFILHRRWQHIFWMIVYLAAYPFHSFLLPIYSFWYMDDFSWGNTRVVIDETKGNRVVLQDDMDVYDPHSVQFELWESYAARHGYPGRERPIVFDPKRGRVVREVYEDPVHYANWQNDLDMPKEEFDNVDASTHRRSNSLQTLKLPTDGFDAGTVAQTRATIEQILNTCDLSTMTSGELRSRVSEMLGLDFSGATAEAFDALIDAELEKLDE